MREILFRGKNEAGIWHYGAYLPYESGEVAILESFSKYGYEAVELSRRCKVIPETVGQYTGLTDKNGKKIFEGDIVDCWSEGINAQGAVRQRIDGLWIIYPAWQNQQFWGLCPNRNGSTTVKIIGNIHDNPELLKGGAE